MTRTEFLVEHTTDEMFEFKTAMIFWSSIHALAFNMHKPAV